MLLGKSSYTKSVFNQNISFPNQNAVHRMMYKCVVCKFFIVLKFQIIFILQNFTIEIMFEYFCYDSLCKLPEFGN